MWEVGDLGGAGGRETNQNVLSERTIYFQILKSENEREKGKERKREREVGRERKRENTTRKGM